MSPLLLFKQSICEFDFRTIGNMLWMSYLGLLAVWDFLDIFADYCHLYKSTIEKDIAIRYIDLLNLWAMWMIKLKCIQKGNSLFIQWTAKKVDAKKNKKNKEKCVSDTYHNLYIIVTLVTFPYKHTSENDLTFPWGLSWEEEKKKRKEKKFLKLLYFPTCKKNINDLLDFIFQLFYHNKKGNNKWNWLSLTGTTFYLKVQLSKQF